MSNQSKEPASRFRGVDAPTASGIESALKVLVGINLTGVCLFGGYATHLYFGNSERKQYLAIECPWRFSRKGMHLIGSGDADPETPGITELEARFESMIATNSLKILDVKADSLGGIKLYFQAEHQFELFPSSVTKMEWLFRGPEGLTLMYNEGSLCRKVPVDLESPPPVYRE